jgi:hypothetical protein
MTTRKTASRQTVKAARPIPASIPMPDSPIRQKSWYQIYSRLARPSLDWIGVFGAMHAFGLLDGLRFFSPADDARAIIILGFVAALYGIRTVEKTQGVA